MTVNNSITVNSFAKINWTLDVLFKREDGYHEIRTIYQTVSLRDRLHLSETESAIEIVCDDSRVPTDESNLVYKAAARLRGEAGINRGAHIEIEKRIPVAGGLGGGSSNAAATLIGLARLWQINIDERAMIEIAALLGSDVPFFLMGGTALGVGRGEEVYPLEDTECDYLVLANPGIAVSTAAAYEKLSRLTRSEAARIIPFSLMAAKAIRDLPLRAQNDFEEVVLIAHAEIGRLRTQLTEAGAVRALMSGSGATVFGVFDNLEASERAIKELRAAGIWAERAHAITRKEYQSALFE
jgi:4-diphosphocytidyl-2-C-methyl-D-erythritol kinase